MIAIIKEKHRNKDEIKEIKISIALISSFVILTIQYFVLVSFNLINSPIAEAIQLASKGLVGLTFLIALPTVIRRSKIKFICSYFLAIFLLIIQYLMFPENRSYVSSIYFLELQ